MNVRTKISHDMNGDAGGGGCMRSRWDKIR